MTFNDWILKKFGERAFQSAADFLGYPKRTVYAWATFYRFPNTTAQEIIKLKTDNQVDFTQWRTTYLSKVKVQK